MAENKTRPTVAPVEKFLKGVKDPAQRADCAKLIDLLKTVSGEPPVMWGSAIIGFGTRHYVYESGREGDTMIVGFSPRKQAIALYLAGGLAPLEQELAALGEHTTGKGCLYIKSLDKVNLPVLKRILAKSYRSVK